MNLAEQINALSDKLELNKKSLLVLLHGEDQRFLLQHNIFVLLGRKAILFQMSYSDFASCTTIVYSGLAVVNN